MAKEHANGTAMPKKTSNSLSMKLRTFLLSTYLLMHAVNIADLQWDRSSGIDGHTVVIQEVLVDWKCPPTERHYG